jgi:dTDP-4-dehydrorhamnose reductase
MRGRLLITGGSGLLGNSIAEKAFRRFKVIATYNKNPVKGKCESIKLDILQRDEVSKAFERIEPTYVIHTAAFTNVDKSEIERGKAWKTNVEGTKNICEACEKVGAKMIYVSSDFVFDGKKGNYKENDKPNPINWYGKTKLEGEKLIKNYDIGYVIARTSVLYGFGGNRPNFVTWVFDKLKRGETIHIVKDQWNSPTFVDNCAEILLELLERGKSGIYHTSGKERISRLDFARKIVEVFNLDKGLIKPIRSEELKQEAKRPRDSSLSVDKIKKQLETKPLGVGEGLKRMEEKCFNIRTSRF